MTFGKARRYRSRGSFHGRRGHEGRTRFPRLLLPSPPFLLLVHRFSFPSGFGKFLPQGLLQLGVAPLFIPFVVEAGVLPHEFRYLED